MDVSLLKINIVMLYSPGLKLVTTPVAIWFVTFWGADEVTSLVELVAIIPQPHSIEFGRKRHWYMIPLVTEAMLKDFIWDVSV